MEIKFSKTRLAAAVGAVALAMGLSAPAGAVVVVGGDNGWEVSFDGNVNAFYTNIDQDAGFTALSAGAATAGAQEDESRVTSGFLPAFFSFNVKSPTVNGLTGSARFSFAPTINNVNNGGLRLKSSLYTSGSLQGASIDTREVLANVSGSFGTISYGRTLSIFGRNAILSDMTLFGVGITGANNGGVTAGRIGRGYVYPDFQARFSYTTPDINGFKAEVGMYDPFETVANSSVGTNNVTFNETDTPRFEGEASYSTAFSGGNVKIWVDGQWQELGQTAGGLNATVQGVGFGANVGFGGLGLTGYYYTGEGLSQSLQFTGLGDVWSNAAGTAIDEANNDGWYVQGTYTFNGVTKVGASYGESNSDKRPTSLGFADLQDSSAQMYTVGIYHDVTPWLKVIGEYSHATNENFDNSSPEADIFSVGSFILW